MVIPIPVVRQVLASEAARAGARCRLVGEAFDADFGASIVAAARALGRHVPDVPDGKRPAVDELQHLYEDGWIIAGETLTDWPELRPHLARWADGGPATPVLAGYVATLFRLGKQQGDAA